MRSATKFICGWWLGLAASPAGAQQVIELVSRSAPGIQAEVGTHRVRLSADGRYVAFATASAVFDPTDTNGLIDVYLKDRGTGSVRRISRGPGGAAALGGHSGWDGFAPDQYGIAVSDDGARVAFLSSATNLAADDGNAFRDAFLWERATDTLTLLSKSAGGAAGNADTVGVAISGDGNVVAFSSFATNLVASDTNNTVDLFARVLDAGSIERVSLTDADAQMPAAPSPDRGALAPSLSRDGRYVGFLCEVNLNVSDCAGQCAEMWVRDRQLGTTIQASTIAGQPGNTASGVLNPVLSPDGRYAAWASFGDMALPDTDSIGDLFFRDLQGGITEHISQTTDGRVGHVACGFPGISAGGRFVTFHCNGSFGPDDGHAGNDVYVRDRQLGQTLRYSVSYTQGQPVAASEFPVITPDGRWLAFESGASNLVPGDANGAVRDLFLVRNPFLFDPPSRLGGGGNASSSEGALSADGRYLFFSTTEALVAGDDNGAVDVYRRELSNGTLERVSLGDGGNQIAGGGSGFAASDDGTRVVFLAPDDGSVVATPVAARRKLGQAPVTVAFLRNIVTGTTQRLGAPGTPASAPAISGDGTRVAFVTPANGLVPGDGNGMDDVYVADAAAPATLVRASAPASGDADGPSGAPALSRDGRFLVLASEASNLATSGPPDGNGLRDVLRVDLALAQRVRLSATSQQSGNGASGEPAISADGRYVVFSSEADNFGGGDGNGASDVYLVDTAGSASPELVSVGAVAAGNGGSSGATISADGSTIAFASQASDLVPGDGNVQADLFVVDRSTRAKRRLARGDGGTEPNGASRRPRLTRDGQRIAFGSFATNLSLSDANGGQEDVYLNGPLDPFRVFRDRFE